MKCSVVTLLTDDSFFPGVQVLLKSLQNVNSKYEFRVMVGPGVSASIFNRLSRLPGCCGGIRVDEILSPYNIVGDTTGAPSFVQSQLTKLNLWNLTDYDRVLYIDADCMVVQNIDELFDLDIPFAASPDIFPPDKFNAGVMLVRPNEAVYRSMLQSIGVLKSYDGGDTGFLNSYFHDWYQSDYGARLPFGYNAQRTLHWFTKKNPAYWESIQPLKIIHFCSSPKPWEVSMTSKTLGPLELLWWQTFIGH